MKNTALTDTQRKQIHDLALSARELLTREARDLLEGAYGLYPDGRMDPPEKLPQVRADPETAETYRRLKQFLADEVRAGLAREEAVEKLVKEVAYTHLNRLVAFKMMEARKLIRGTLDKGTESNAFKFYLADADHAADLALYERGERDAAYRRFLLWQAGRVAREIRVLFDPDNLPSRLFPRPPALHKLLALLNDPALSPAWEADETIGWIYQYFNEEEKAEVFDRLYKQKKKIRRQDIPAATQLFTPDWIVRFLVQNTLGRTWVQMHPDTRLLGTELLDYLVPLEGEVPAEPLRPVSDIALLDPSCGTMHFGLVAFDLFAAMYREEMARAGEGGWPAKPSVSAEDDIAAAILKHNLFGIDIDLRAVQLSALTLYLKAKSLNKNARITDSNLVCADVLPLNGARLGTFLREAKFARPVYERLIRALWERLQHANEVGSLLRLERDLGELIAAERAGYAGLPLFAGVPGEFEREAAEQEFWEIISIQIMQGLDEFARQQAEAGVDQTYFAGEAVKGLRLMNIMLRPYDVVVTNPPYSGKGNLDDAVSQFLDKQYPDEKGDLYTAFIKRCSELVGDSGRLGMITQQSFMFLSSYEKLRANLRERFAIETMAHTGTRAFAEISGEVVNTTVFVLRREADADRRESATGTYFRLVHAPDGEGKRLAFEQALQEGDNIYHVAQRRFSAIPGSPWVYWIRDNVRRLFETLPPLEEYADPRQGLATADNVRFLRLWWEVGLQGITASSSSESQFLTTKKRWAPLMKGGQFRKWYGNQEFVINWEDSGRENKTYIIEQYPYLNGDWAWVIKNSEFYFTEGVTFTDLTGGGLSVRYMPPGFIFDRSGNCLFPIGQTNIWALLALLNSSTFNRLMAINPTIHFYISDFKRIPVPRNVLTENRLATLAVKCTSVHLVRESLDETSLTFLYPLISKDLEESLQQVLILNELEIDKIVETSYGTDTSSQEIINDLDARQDALIGRDAKIAALNYAVGIVLGRFQPGVPGALGRAVYHRDDFAIGSLPAPDEAEFNELVGPPERFAYINDRGGRHVFPAAVEQALRDLAVPDGITVLDAGHPRDLPALVDKALRLMLGDADARAVITEAAGGDLRKFLERDYFTQWHFKWYRKRPVYWPLQSAKRSYGFVLFHEKIDDQTFFRLQRDYLDAKLNGLSQQIEDLRGRAAGQSGAALKRLARQIDRTTQALEEITDFARAIERIVNDGYRPRPDWIDDGVILRLAPLWELIPIWKTEPKKYWERLQAGDYDWSHIAMAYWPERVREACKTNKSFAIAHGLAER